MIVTIKILFICCRFLCRLTPALCLNFLRLINLDYSHHTEPFSAIEQASFTQIMGHMDVLSFIRNSFDIYLPLVMVAFGVGTYLRFCSKILHLMDIEQFYTDDEVTLELIREGKELVQREKNKRLRFSEGISRQSATNRGPISVPLESPGSNPNLRLAASEEERPTSQSQEDQQADHVASRNVQDYKSFERRVPPPSDIFDDV